MYSATFKRRPSEGVGHDLTNHTSLSSRFIAYLGSIRGEIRPGCRSRPQTMCTGFPHHQTGDRYTVPRTCRVTAHPEGQHCARPPVNYKHQKLVATPGQRTRAVNKSSGVIFQGPMCGSSCFMDQPTQNSVPEDGFNETTHHVLLHGLSSLPLPNCVHMLNSQHQNMA